MPAKLWAFYDFELKMQSTPMSQDEAQYLIMKLKPHNINHFYIWTEGWENWVSLVAYLKSDQRYFMPPAIKIFMPESFEDTATATATHTETKHEEELANARFNANQPEPGKIKRIKKRDDIELENLVLGDHTVAKMIKVDHSAPAIELKLSPDADHQINFLQITNKRLKARATRHHMQLEILMVTKKGKEFRNHSINISTSGVMIEDELPVEFYLEPFSLTVYNRLAKDRDVARVHLTGKAIGRFKGKNSRQIEFKNVNDAQLQQLKDLLDEYLKLETGPKSVVTKVS